MGSKPLIRKRIITNQAMANFIIMLKNELPIKGMKKMESIDY
jgi:hypothetical protein